MSQPITRLRTLRLGISCVMMLSMVLCAGCHKSQYTKSESPQWSLVGVSGGITGSGYTPDFDGITLTDSSITYFKGRTVLEMKPVSLVSGTSIFDGLPTTLLLIDGIEYVKVITDGQLQLKMNAYDGYQYDYTAGFAN